MMKKIYSYPETALLVLAAEGVILSESGAHLDGNNGQLVGDSE